MGIVSLYSFFMEILNAFRKCHFTELEQNPISQLNSPTRQSAQLRKQYSLFLNFMAPQVKHFGVRPKNRVIFLISFCVSILIDLDINIAIINDFVKITCYRRHSFHIFIKCFLLYVKYLFLTLCGCLPPF